MIKKLQRAVPALTLSVLPLLATAVPAHAADSQEAITSTSTSSAVHESASLFEGIDRIRAAAESREGYTRTAFKHWNAGRLPEDGCNTRVICIARLGWVTTVLVHEHFSSRAIPEACESQEGGRPSKMVAAPLSRSSSTDMIPEPARSPTAEQLPCRPDAGQ
ncbi:hypothetical protein [Streptomyces sp. NPDC054797]